MTHNHWWRGRLGKRIFILKISYDKGQHPIAGVISLTSLAWSSISTWNLTSVNFFKKSSGSEQYGTSSMWLWKRTTNKEKETPNGDTKLSEKSRIKSDTNWRSSPIGRENVSKASLVLDYDQIPPLSIFVTGENSPESSWPTFQPALEAIDHTLTCTCIILSCHVSQF